MGLNTWEEKMGWIFSIGFMIFGAVINQPICYIAAGLFAIAGSISFFASQISSNNKENKS